MKQVHVGWYREPKSKDEYWDPDTYKRRNQPRDLLGLERLKRRPKTKRIKGKPRTIPVTQVQSGPRFHWGSWRYSTLDEAIHAVIANLGCNYPVRYGELDGWQYCQIGDEVVVWR